MDTPFEIPYCILEDAPENRHTRLLRPYIEKLIQTDVDHPVHSNPYNRFSVIRDDVQEETLEYWISDNEDALGAATNMDSESESDPDSDSDQDMKKKNSHKKRKRKADPKIKARKAHIKLAHDAQICSADAPSDYEFNSREVQHIKQQMYLSLQQKSRSSMPPEIQTKDINMALIALSGYEYPLPSVYFRPTNQNHDRVSFIKYLSRVIDTLFYISLYKGNWKQCYRLFSILVRTFDTDIHQIWTLGVHMLCELNTTEFEKFFHVEWMKFSSKSAVPKLSPKVLNDMAFLQNPSLVPLLYKNSSNPDIIRVLQRTVSQRRPMYDIILKFLRLLMRTSRNQHPLIGAYPEQTYVSGGILAPEKKSQTTSSTTQNINGLDNTVGNEESQEENENFESNGNQLKERSSKRGHQFDSDSEFDKENTETDLDTDTDTEQNLPDNTIEISAAKTPIVIKSSDFNPRADNHIPHQQIFRKALKRHSTPLHKQGTRVRTPSYTLSYLWILVRAGRLNVVQRALEPLLLVVPTSVDARVELANLASRILDVAGAAHEISLSDEYEWEKISLVEGRLSEIDDCWEKWKDQFTSRRKKKRKGIRQFEGYTDVENSLARLKKWVNRCLKNNKGDEKKKFGLKSSQKGSNRHIDSDDSENTEGYVTADEEDKESQGSGEDVADATGNIDEEEEDAEEEAIRKEMERLMGYSAIVDNGAGAKEGIDKEIGFGDEDEDEDDEEVQREMERLMGYAEEHSNFRDHATANDDGDDDDEDNNFKMENEQFFNEYNKWNDADTDSD